MPKTDGTNKRRPRRGTTPYLVTGPAPGFLNGVCEWTSAVNEKQAILQVARQLEQKYPDIRIYLGDCRAIRHKGKPKNAASGFR